MKCDDSSCCLPKVVQEVDWLPDPVLDNTELHFKPFSDVYKKIETTDDSRPSNQELQNRASEEDQVSCTNELITSMPWFLHIKMQLLKSNISHTTHTQIQTLLSQTKRCFCDVYFQGCKTSLLTAQRAKCVATCKECLKPRVVYAQNPKSITNKDLLDIEMSVTEYDYTCGSQLLPTFHPLFKKVFVRIGLNCGSPVEFSFYSSTVKEGMLGMPDICCHCGGHQASRPQALLTTYKIVLPICERCEALGKKAITKMPRHT